MESSEPHRKTPIERALDLFVYAPVGFVAEAPSLLPRFVKRGHEQVAVVRALGMYAIRRNPEELEEVVERHPGARSTLQALGLVPAARRDHGANGSGTVHRSTLASVSDHRERAGATGAPAGIADDGDDTSAEPTGPVIDPATLAIPDYESLSASQVVPRLESLTTDELEAIRLYENGNRARRTILNKIAQLQAS